MLYWPKMLKARDILLIENNVKATELVFQTMIKDENFNWDDPKTGYFVQHLPSNVIRVYKEGVQVGDGILDKDIVKKILKDANSLKIDFSNGGKFFKLFFYKHDIQLKLVGKIGANKRSTIFLNKKNLDYVPYDVYIDLIGVTVQ